MGPIPVLRSSPAAGLAWTRARMFAMFGSSSASRSRMRLASRVASDRAVAVAMGSSRVRQRAVSAIVRAPRGRWASMPRSVMRSRR